MRLSSSAKLDSLLGVIACLGATAIGATGCFFVSDNSGDASTPVPAPTTTRAVKVGIDTDATITAKPGDGVGVFVQYAAGGHWTVSTACDTFTSGASCNFELFIAGVDRTTTLSNQRGQNLAGLDSVALQGDGTLHFTSETSTALNGVTFDATPGAPIEIEMFLDTAPEARFIYWIGDKVLHTGAPTDPVDFAPSAM